VLGAVLGEVQLGFLEDGDEVRELLYASGAVAKFVRVVEVRKITAARRELASMSGWMTCLLILSPMSLVALEGDHVLEAGPLRIVTGGAKSSESPYLSEMYLMNQHEQT